MPSSKIYAGTRSTAHLSMWLAFLLACLLSTAALAVEPAELAAPAEPPVTAADREHWAFRPLARPDLPDVNNSGWCRTPTGAGKMDGRR